MQRVAAQLTNSYEFSVAREPEQIYMGTLVEKQGGPVETASMCAARAPIVTTSVQSNPGFISPKGRGATAATESNNGKTAKARMEMSELLQLNIKILLEKTEKKSRYFVESCDYAQDS